MELNKQTELSKADMDSILYNTAVHLFNASVEISTMNPKIGDDIKKMGDKLLDIINPEVHMSQDSMDNIIEEILK